MLLFACKWALQYEFECGQDVVLSFVESCDVWVVQCWNESDSVAFVHITYFLGVVVSFRVFLYLLVGRVLVFCVVDLLLFLSGVWLNGGCGPRETHSGLSQSVSHSSTVVLCSFGWVLCFVVRDLCFPLLLCVCSSVLFCDCGCGCGGMWTVLLLLVFDFRLILSCF